jgi:hypothetical protein
MKFPRLLILFLSIVPLACAPAAQAPAPRQAAVLARPRAVVADTQRVIYDHNLTPLGGDKTARYMQSLGFQTATVCYNGTLNLTGTWSKDGKLLDKAGVWNNANNINPPNENAVKAFARLALEPGHFGAPVANGPVEIFYDLEGAEAPSGNDVVKVVQWTKQIVGEDRKVCWYGWPQYSQGEAADAQLAQLLTAPCVSLYNWDEVVASNGDAFYRHVRESNELIAKRCPNAKRKIAFVFPYNQVYFGNSAPEVKAQNNKPVPLPRWKAQLAVLKADGWDIFVWMGGAEPGPVKEHLEYAAGLAAK